ncbi:hypothetical protein BOTNAR_0049g00190 [Botryotinia narcissicola]|uniref:Uncharacterized protein n=1 Tax=Botryotinia narcissicola TaxID=278944 RepID=A0A4Z1J648_9HELO|nr:hypothetical protein BOTNAR_0049g00190 [Botryotinia narcissicola]
MLGAYLLCPEAMAEYTSWPVSHLKLYRTRIGPSPRRKEGLMEVVMSVHLRLLQAVTVAHDAEL